MPATYSLTASYTCVPAAGGTLTAVYTYNNGGGPIGFPMQFYLEVVSPSGTGGVRAPISSNGDSAEFPGLSDGTYTVRLLDPGEAVLLESDPVTIACSGGGGGGIVCDLLISHLVVTNATSAGGTGAVNWSTSTRYPPITTHLTRLFPLPEVTALLAPAQPGALQLWNVPLGRYRADVRDAQNCTAAQEFEIAAPAPLIGCMDEDASNYDPLATENDQASCVFTPRWVGAWCPEGVPVYYRPAAVPSIAFVAGDLYAGYPVGHALADVRPLAYVATVRAVVAPSGEARFDLAPYLRSELGAWQADGSRRLDLNSPTAQTDDLYVGFRLEIGGRGVASGYVVNSVLAETRLEELRTSQDPLWPFGLTFPIWPGFRYRTSTLHNEAGGRLGAVQTAPPADFSAEGRLLTMPCPPNPLPVAWLCPEGGYGYWVFEGRHRYGDDIGEGQPYTEALSNELRYSRRAPSRQTVEASSGVFADRALVEGLRSLRRAVQAWYRPTGLVGPWVPIVLQAGSFPAYREGRRRYEMTIQFTEAASMPIQGQ